MLPLPSLPPQVIETQPLIRLTQVRSSYLIPPESVWRDVVYPTGSAVFRCGPSLAGVDIQGGKSWRRKVGSEGTIISYGAYVMVIDGHADGWRISKIHGATGKLAWQTFKSDDSYLDRDPRQQFSFPFYGNPVITEDQLLFIHGNAYTHRLGAIDCKTAVAIACDLGEMSEMVPSLKNKLFAIHDLLFWNGAQVRQESLPRGRGFKSLLVTKQGVVVPYASHAYLYESPEHKGFAFLNLDDIVSSRIRDSLNGAGNGPVQSGPRRSLGYYPLYSRNNEIYCVGITHAEPDRGPVADYAFLSTFDLGKKEMRFVKDVNPGRIWPTNKGLILESYGRTSSGMAKQVEASWWRLNQKRLERIEVPPGPTMGMSPYGILHIPPPPGKNKLMRIRFTKI